MTPGECVFQDNAVCVKIMSGLETLRSELAEVKAGLEALGLALEGIKLKMAEARGAEQAMAQISAQRQRLLSIVWTFVRGVLSKFVSILA